jgi:glutamate-1-semialdehyde 2,1-aminomutase
MSANPQSNVALQEKARRVLPGGTFGNVERETIISRGRGSRVWDEHGNEYIDYLIGSGPMIVGHAHPEVNEAVRRQLDQGTTFFATNPQAIDLAEIIIDAVPCADKVRYSASGSEAVAFAMRLVRAYTGREKILKFEGGYHGYSDYGLMSLAPKKPGNSMEPIPDSPGIPAAIKDTVLIAPFNDADAVESLMKAHEGEIAAVFMEPLQRLIPPQPGFLEAMRELTLAYDMLLVFDEVVTGFRMAYGGAQAYYGVTPDVCTLGKAIGGGFPLAAIAGREEVMALFDSERTSADRFLPQFGTLSGTPVASVAGIATLNILSRPGTYERFFDTGNRLMTALAAKLDAAGFEAQVVGVAPMFDVVFAGGAMDNHRDVLRGDAKLAARLNTLLKERGVLKSAVKYYVSTAIDDSDVAQTIAAWDSAIDQLAAER